MHVEIPKWQSHVPWKAEPRWYGNQCSNQQWPMQRTGTVVYRREIPTGGVNEFLARQHQAWLQKQTQQVWSIIYPWPTVGPRMRTPFKDPRLRIIDKCDR